MRDTGYLPLIRNRKSHHIRTAWEVQRLVDEAIGDSVGAEAVDKGRKGKPFGCVMKLKTQRWANNWINENNAKYPNLVLK